MNQSIQKKKSYRPLERIVKGFASHRRLEILVLLNQNPELSVMEISKKIGSDIKNVSAHVQKMAVAGLLLKKSQGNRVCNTLSRRGKQVLQFVRILE